jgi:acyl carrier protein
MTIEQQVRTFITDELNWPGDAAELTPDYPLVQNRVVDSLGIMQLLSFLEERFGIAIADDEFVPENFASIRSITDFVDSKLAARSA